MKFNSFLFLLLFISNFSYSFEIKTDNQSIDEIIYSFDLLKNKYIEEQDHRLVFTYIYLESTKEIKKQIHKGTYFYPAWVENVTVKFGNLYLKSINSYDNGESLPLCWKKSFDVNMTKKYYLSMQLLLGINAHINHDLAFALDGSFKDGFRPYLVKRDFFKMNELFDELTPVFFNLLYEMEDLLGVSSNDKGFKEYMIFNYIKWMRKDAWQSGLNLHRSNELNRNFISNKIKNDALDHAELIFSGRFFIPRR